MSNHDNQIQTIDYRWIIQTLSMGEQGQEFFDLYSAINPNPYSYSESELYLHYFRLFNPVEYLHPTFDECDNNMWNMLLQLLFGNLTAECTLTHSTDNTLPELEFSYPPVGTMKCSELTTDILKPLLLCLLSAAAAINLLVFILPLVNTAVLYTTDNGGVLVLSCVYSVLIFKEKLTPSKLAGMILAVASIVALSI